MLNWVNFVQVRAPQTIMFKHVRTIKNTTDGPVLRDALLNMLSIWFAMSLLFQAGFAGHRELALPSRRSQEIICYGTEAK